MVGDKSESLCRWIKVVIGVIGDNLYFLAGDESDSLRTRAD